MRSCGGGVRWLIAGAVAQRNLFSKYPDSRTKSMAEIEKAVMVRCTRVLRTCVALTRLIVKKSLAKL